MCEAITKGISVKVKAKYQHDVSQPKMASFFYSYKVTITNNGFEPVKLISRVWEIKDSIGENLYVEGDGVVGLQPEILPGESFQYESNVVLKTGLGEMFGTYTLINKITYEQFPVAIPVFKLIAPFCLN
jgi:ApaG protein